MKAKNVQLGQTYNVKVSGTVVPVVLTSTNSLGGWNGRSTVTGRQIRIRTAGRLRPFVCRSVSEGEAMSEDFVGPQTEAEAHAEWVAEMESIDRSAFGHDGYPRTTESPQTDEEHYADAPVGPQTEEELEIAWNESLMHDLGD